MKNATKKTRQLTIGVLAEACNVGVSTILFYQRIGLLSEPPKPMHGGYRVYDNSHLERLCQIKNAQAFGFTLKEIETILCHSDSNDCKSVKSIITDRLEAINSRIHELQDYQEGLSNLAECCNGTSCINECSLAQKLTDCPHMQNLSHREVIWVFCFANTRGQLFCVLNTIRRDVGCT